MTDLAIGLPDRPQVPPLVSRARTGLGRAVNSGALTKLLHCSRMSVGDASCPRVTVISVASAQRR